MSQYPDLNEAVVSQNSEVVSLSAAVKDVSLDNFHSLISSIVDLVRALVS